MKVLIEAVGTDVLGGGRSVVCGLLQSLLAMDRENTYELLLSRVEPSFLPNVHQEAVGIRNRFLARAWLQLILPRWVRAHQVDLVHFTKNLGAFRLPCPYIVTVHDLTTLRYHKLFPMVDVIYWRVVEPLMLRSAEAVVTVSADTRRDVICYYGVPGHKVHVVHNAYSPSFRVMEEAAIDRIRRKYSLPERFILHVGSISPKKNLGTLLEAFAHLKHTSSLPQVVVLVGREYRSGSKAPLLALLEKLGIARDVLFTGSVPDEDLPAIYAAADLFVLSSLHEGFGMVLLEAMACGTPVVASSVGAVPEVVGEAALLVKNPTDPIALAGAIRRALDDSRLRDALVSAGLRRVGEFSWAKAAAGYLNIYRAVCGEVTTSSFKKRQKIVL